MRCPIIGFDPDYDALYDPQQASPAGFCERCGREIYAPFQPLCERCLAEPEAEDE